MTKLFPLLFPATYLFLLLIERFLPGRPQPEVRRWVGKGVLFFAVSGLINANVPRAVASLMRGRSLLHLGFLGTSGGTAAAIVASTLVAYLVHRTTHRSMFLWRWFHQMHHSAERVDIAGFSYSHPFDLALFAATSTLTVTLLGVSATAATLAGYATFVLGLLTHLNVRTPRWMGYVFQRPEAHALHHQRGVHAYNYGLPLWDLVFGTFRNPKTVEIRAGFWDGASARVWDMLRGRNVDVPRAT
jgi:sterol desaturase/sphingolipid hydroxylase (fatty acid hydroxylase superfamily)